MFSAPYLFSVFTVILAHETTITVDPSRTFIVCEHTSAKVGRCEVVESTDIAAALAMVRPYASPGVILSAQSLRDAKAGRE